ncbi:TylF/MycF/NovP-related O-methyltransferase [Methylocapsa palsarum]|uniref:Macrocin-O-methyltransferase (TylF) n=1 Tax=Methylocapsa palsarum TaxID=1612308 RepID=A0A1I3WPU2_9HYPH|nr:TylF/MycF/NovP-related O-methyltransferase [Methylocapsa palsarum]SFK09535.1 Macrocin-O-methyltransferase (TylF) [Methylocapsa palsarum]
MSDSTEQSYSMVDPRSQTSSDRQFAEGMEAFFAGSLGSNLDKLRTFPKFAPRQALAQFLAKNELFQAILPVHGHIVECGVYLGAGLMTWANLSAIFEPVNHTRRVVGFDTFAGFVEFSEKDAIGSLSYAQPKGLAADSYTDLQDCIRLFDLNRPIGHIPRVELVRGDACETIPKYLATNAHLVVAMLYLDFDLYEPTKIAIETFLPRMPKGAILAFDELNQAGWPGETAAVMDAVGLRNLRIRRFPTTPALSYAILE